MFNKKLAIIYYYSRPNEGIAKEDHQLFYGELKDNQDLKNNRVIVDQNFCPTVVSLKEKLETLIDEPFSEIYLHFSGHGETGGIPFDNWKVDNESFAIMLDHPKIKSCFFSSCQSAELVKIVSARDIPVVIGTRGDNKIENGFAIEFQRRFYKSLAKRNSFKSAFETARTEIETEKQIQLCKGKDKGITLRGEMSLDDLEAPALNKLQIIFSDETEKQRHLIYPTVVKAMTYVEKEKQIIFAYAENDNLLEEFEEVFNHKEFHQYYKLFLLNDNDLQRLAEKDTDEIFVEDIKIVFIIQSDKDIFENDYLKDFFDNKKVLEHKYFKFAIALKKGINASLDFLKADYFKDYFEVPSDNEADDQKHPIITYSSFEDLFNNHTFDHFLTNFSIDLASRKKHILRFPCGEMRKDIKPPKKKGEKSKNNYYIRVFFALQKNIRLVNYVINWLKNYAKINTPIIISDTTHKKEMTLTEALKDAIKNSFKEGLQENLVEKKLRAILLHLIGGGQHIIVFKTNFDDIEKLKEEICSLLKDVDAISEFDPTPPQKPTFIFFINKNDILFSDSLTEEKPYTTKSFSIPGPVSPEDFDKWIDIMRNEDLEYDELLENLGATDFQQFKERCPSNIIELVCHEIKIPSKQILSIS